MEGRLKVRKRVEVNSLHAAICNITLFKRMKDEDFKNRIFISYSQEGVILEAVSEEVWNEANNFILSWIESRKIEILTHGYDKEVYENLINHELKEYTKQLKEVQTTCPYINLIHYNRLMRTCQFMNKQKYEKPLRLWQKKNRQFPKFAYLVVWPQDRFEEIKRAILKMLQGSDSSIRDFDLRPQQLLYLYFDSPKAELLRELNEKKQIHLQPTKTGDLRLTTYVEFDFILPEIRIQPFSKGLLKTRARLMRHQQIIPKINAALEELPDCKDLIKQFHESSIRQHGDDHCWIIFAKEQTASVQAVLKKDPSSKEHTEEVRELIRKFAVCSLEDVEIVRQRYHSAEFTSYVAIVNQCHMMLDHYNICDEDLENFLQYLRQLHTLYNASMLRFYGITLNADGSYYLLFDYKSKTLSAAMSSGDIVDETQAAALVQKLMYSLQALHSHPQPRTVGRIETRDIFLPCCLKLPYLPENESEDYSFQNDVKLLGQLLSDLIQDPSPEMNSLIEDMTCKNSFSRIKLPQAISRIEAFTQV